jgi:hypothetical protein
MKRAADPIDHRNASRATARIDSARAISFKAYAEQFIGAREGTWKNAKHGQQWRNSRRDHAYPHIGTLSIPEIDTDAVLKVLRPI